VRAVSRMPAGREDVEFVVAHLGVGMNVCIGERDHGDGHDVLLDLLSRVADLHCSPLAAILCCIHFLSCWIRT